MTERDKGIATLLVEGGRRNAWRRCLVNVPPERASTLLFESVEQLEATRPGLGSYNYGLQGTATHWSLADALTQLEQGAAGTILYPSGLAAITTPILALLKPGDQLLVPDSVYGPTRQFCGSVLKRFGITVTFYDPLIGAGIEPLIGESTRMILLESPGSLTMEVQDVPGICAIARRHRIPTLLDNSWATPLLFPAIAYGVDISAVAATKYVGGHADVMLGATAATTPYFEQIQRFTWDLGYTVSADDAWLGLRGLRTMAIRLKQHEENALKIARWLKEQPQVGAVLHPALTDCPGHEHWLRDFKGSSGLFSFELKAADARARFVDGLELFGIGYSWGGYESLALPVDPHRAVSTAPAPNLVRLHIGLEDPEDLIADLTAAFKRTEA